MDKRLELTLTDYPTARQTRTLCTYAVLCAKQDLNREEPDEVMGNFIASHLGRVISLGFMGGWNIYQPLDVFEVGKVLDSCARPAELTRKARQLGDQCLFLYSQDCLPDNPRKKTADEKFVGLGRHGYSTASANSFDWSNFDRRLLSRVEENFVDYAQVLGLAGVLLGFSPVGSGLISPRHPIVTIDDFLESLALFTRHPTQPNWQALKQAKENHQWIDSEFSFELPTEPK